MAFHLSKRRYLAGRQCALRMWRQQHRPELAAPISGFQRALFSNGKEVAERARERFAGGTLIPRDQHWSESVEATHEALRDPTCSVIYQGAFERDGVRVRAEILERIEAERWHILEVKSTVRTRGFHYDDLALQCWVIDASEHLVLERMSIVTLNRDYVFDGKTLELDHLLRIHDATEGLTERIETISQLTQELITVIENPEAPVAQTGSQCNKPRPCEFHDHCSGHIVPADYPLTLIPNLDQRTKKALKAQGINDVRNIPEKTKLDALQKRVLESIKTDSPVGSPKLPSILEKITYPVHHIDFESFMIAIPRFSNTKPYEGILFQWSNHIEAADGTIDHLDFVFDGDGDPRRAFAESLLAAVGEEGSLCIYSNYEEVAIRQLANLFEDLREPLSKLLKRTWDLFEVIRKHFYHPAFGGSYSIKRVLPALCPKHDYSELEISDGKDAMQAYLHSLSLDPEQRVEVHRQLKQYCALDTWAMVEIRRALATHSKLSLGRS